MDTLHVNFGPRSYPIQVTAGNSAGMGAFARQQTSTTMAVVVSDENVQTYAQAVMRSLEAEGFRCAPVVLPAGEMQKSLSGAGQLYDALAGAGADRRTLVVAVGGGVVGDLAGFAAATFHRGLPLLMVPTTLLAMVDSSVGGKVAINHPQGKNLIGAFHQPLGVWIDIQALDTLPDREFRSGLAEVVKYGVILDPDLFTILEQSVDAILARDPALLRTLVGRSCRIKADVVEQDEREETGLRVILNYGHTFAHAFETVAGYGTWLHGEAVAAGMACASRLAEQRGMIGADFTLRQDQLLRAFGLPTAPLDWPIEALLAAMNRDKKASAGRLRFILPVRLGKVMLVDDIPEQTVRELLERIC
jgi:3-dehydroquinate synthase